MAHAPLQHLASFLAVAEHRSFTRAASAQGISKSAVSQAVRALEAHLGVPLVARTTRSVSLTEAGARLRDRASGALTQLHEALLAASAPEGEPTGRLRVNVPGIAVKSVMTPVLPSFLARYPKVSVELRVENRLVDIVAERFDAGVRLVETVQRDMVTARLSGPFRFVVVASPGYLAAHGRPRHPRELVRHVCIGFDSPTTGAPVPWDLERAGRVWKVPATGRVSTNEPEALVQLALAGTGLAYVSELEVAPLLANGRLEVVLPAWAPEVPGFFLYFPSRSQTSVALRAFIACAREVLRQR